MNRYLLLCFILLFGIFRRTSAQQAPVTCSTPEPQATPALRELMSRLSTNPERTNARIKAAPMLECLVGVDVDYTVLRLYNDIYKAGEERIRRDIYWRMVQISKVFEEEIGVKLTVSHIKIWKDSDPYRSTNPGVHLAAVDQYWRDSMKTVPYRIVIGYSARFGGGQADLRPGILTRTSVAGLINYEFDKMLTAHELGHTFGSFHTHNCSWPEGPIDYCATVEGACYTGKTEEEVGTIMSYCGRELTFHPFCRQVMRQSAERSELPVIDKAPDGPIVSSEAVSIEHHNPYLTWLFTPRTEAYQVQIARDSTFREMVFDTLVSVPLFRAYNLLPETSYYMRVKAMNKHGQSAWSSIRTLIRGKGNDLSIPTLLAPAPDKWGYQGGQFIWTASPGATHYQVQVSYTMNFVDNTVVFDANSYALSVPLPVQKINAGSTWKYYWRIRAWYGERPGEWSEVRQFSLPPRVEKMYPDSNLIKTRKFGPVFLIGATIGASPNTMFSVEVSPKPDFSAPIYRREKSHWYAGSKVSPSGWGLGIIDSLEANRNYYFRIRASSPEGGGSWHAGQFATGRARPAWRYYTPFNSPLPTFGINQIWTDFSRTVWLATNDGLYRFSNEKTWTRFSLPNTGSQLKLPVQAVIGDGTLVWAATYEGLVRWTGTDWKLFPWPTGGDSQNVQKLLLARGRTVIVVTNYFIHRFDGSSWVSTPNPLPRSNIFYDAVVDANNHVWACFYNTDQGVARYDGQRWDIMTTGNRNLPRGYGLRLAIDNTLTQVWLSGTFGIARYTSAQTWEMAHSYPITADNDYVFRVTFDRKNNPIALSRRYFIRYDGKQWTRDAENFLTNAEEYTVMTVDYEKRLWIGGRAAGLSVYDERNLIPGAIKPTYCAGDSIRMPYDKLDMTFEQPVSHKIQLLDTNNRVLQTLPGRFWFDTAAFKAPTVAGNYRVRIVTGSPLIYGDASTTFAVTPLPEARAAATGDARVYAPEKVTLTANTEPGLNYQWFRNGTAIGGATAVNYDAAESGEYTVRVTSQAGCTNLSGPVTIFIDIPLSTTSADADLTLSPNPAEQRCLVKLKRSYASATRLTVVDMAGRVVMRRTISAGDQTMELNLSSVPGGRYLLKAENQDIQIARQLIKL